MLLHISLYSLLFQLPLLVLAAVSGLEKYSKLKFMDNLITKDCKAKKNVKNCRLVLFVSFLGCVGSCQQSRCLVALVRVVFGHCEEYYR